MSAKINVYACGGCGSKLVNAFESATNAVGAAELDLFYLDTGTSNLKALKVTEDQTHIFQIRDQNGRILEGAGKSRAAVNAEVESTIHSVLEKFPGVYPLNIVVFAHGGGSGSVIGPWLIRALLEQRLPTVAICVGAATDTKTITNSVNTLLTLDNFSRAVGLPVVMSYHYNGTKSLDSDVDRNARNDISALAVLCSNENHGLDHDDLKNFFQFSDHTSAEACLASLDITHSLDDLREIEYPVAIASLVAPGNEMDIGSLGADYYCEGPIGDERINETHYVINVNDPAEMHQMLSEAKTKLEQRSANRPKTKPLGGMGGGDVVL